MALTDGLIAYYGMDEASGTRADAHASWDLAETGTMPSAAGLRGDAVDCGAGRLEGDATAFQTGADGLGISVWLRPDTYPSTWAPVDKDGIRGGGLREWGLLGFGTSIYLYVFGSWGNTAASVSMGAAGSWKHILAEYDAGTATVRISVNGGTPATATHAAGTPNRSTTPLYVGQRRDTEPYDGRLDLLGVWDRPFTADERTQLYNGGAGLSYAELAGGTAPSLSVPLSV
ncbi:LamG-like jellyroll fold domain-containing protein, partial [Alienimonas sp. DA493]|uniref:LamG-like jellyroll fold domain-containing protein n=1 Tax=Alienimonas sp. DA493 TaxID=3373605 RepID=UPI00375425CA